jgi:thiol-disulfide isomerase/thioredoxin
VIKLLVGVLAVLAFFVLNKSDRLPDIRLQAQNTNLQQDEYRYVQEKCASDKCLVIYLAPWCPSCQKITPTIIALSEELKKEGISMSVIVGQDDLEVVSQYGSKFPFPIFTDVDGSYYRELGINGVPYFAVTDVEGHIGEDLYGGYARVADLRKKLFI